MNQSEPPTAMSTMSVGRLTTLRGTVPSVVLPVPRTPPSADPHDQTLPSVARRTGELPTWAKWAGVDREATFTLGVEEEAMFVAPNSWNLAGAIDEILPRLPADVARHASAETHAAALDPSHWDLSGLDSTATQFTINYYHDHNFNIPRPMIAGWLGDTWRVKPKLTLNLGARYDVAWDDFISPGVKPTSIIINAG